MTKLAYRIDPNALARARELRREQTPLESRLWAHLRDRQLGGFKFRRQMPIGPFVVDFCCPACHLVVEIDGNRHAEQEEYDRARTGWLGEQGYRVIRLGNRDVLHRMEGVLEVILEACEGKDPPSPPPLSLPGRGVP